MIKIFVNGRKATLIQTIEIPTGNVESISCEFETSSEDELWAEGVKIAVFSAVTPTGLRKTLPAVIDGDGVAQIPGIIISTPNSTVYAGIRATLPDGSIVATNLVDCGKTVFGSGGDDMIETDGVIKEADFNAFIEEFEAAYEAAIQPLQESVATLRDDIAALPTFNDSDFVSDADYVHTDNNLSDELKSDYDSASFNSHTHDNKAILDDITTELITEGKIPAGGTAGQTLAKISNDDFGAAWITPFKTAAYSGGDEAFFGYSVGYINGLPKVNGSGGFAAGEGASAGAGGAIGSGASSSGGSGFAGGYNAKVNRGKGAAVGQDASAGNGAAVGQSAEATTGGAVGYNAAVSNGGAVGQSAEATTGGAVGYNAKATTGFAGGYSAKATATNAVQLGGGTNADAGTLQFRNYKVIDADGAIPSERIVKYKDYATGITAANDLTLFASAGDPLIPSNAYIVGVAIKWTADTAENAVYYDLATLAKNGLVAWTDNITVCHTGDGAGYDDGSRLFAYITGNNNVYTAVTGNTDNVCGFRVYYV